MTAQTRHFGLNKLRRGDSFSDDNYKFTDADRDTVDTVAFFGLNHHHTGGPVGDGSVTGPVDPPGAVGVDAGGSIPNGLRLRYVYTIVDGDGFESLPSPEEVFTTPDALDTPDPPTLDRTSGGTLPPGQYVYGLTSARVTGGETTVGESLAAISIPQSFSTSTITLTLPAQPVGVDHFTVYRRSPGNNVFFYVGTTADGDIEFVDDGLTANCDFVPPIYDNSGSNTKVDITVDVGLGATWKLYRSLEPDDDPLAWDDSFLAHITDESSPGQVVLTFGDTGGGATTGSPPTTAPLALTQPDKIDLETETTGVLPPSQIAVHSVIVPFILPGTVTVAAGTYAWTCPYEEAIVRDVLPTLGVDSTVDGAGTAVQVDLLRGEGIGAWTSLLLDDTSTPTYAEIPVGLQVGFRYEPPATTDTILALYDQLRVDVIQDGGGAHTDTDLLVQVRLWVRDDPVADPVFP